MMPAPSDVVTLWKAPQKERLGAAEEVVEGFSAQRYPDKGPFFYAVY